MAEIDLDTLLEGEPVISAPSSSLTVEEIKAMIAQLSVTEDGEPLSKAMADLKRALLANPTACTLLLPEDIGAMVKEIYRLTGKQLEAAVAAIGKKGKGKEAKVDLSDAKVQQTIMDDLDT